MKKPAEQFVVANTSVWMQCIEDNCQCTMPVLFVSGMGVASPYTIYHIMLNWCTPKMSLVVQILVWGFLPNPCSMVSFTKSVHSRTMWLCTWKVSVSCNLQCNYPNRTWDGWRLIKKSTTVPQLMHFHMQWHVHDAYQLILHN